jgi:hypothetical protein
VHSSHPIQYGTACTASIRYVPPIVSSVLPSVISQTVVTSVFPTEFTVSVPVAPPVTIVVVAIVVVIIVIIVVLVPEWVAHVDLLIEGGRMEGWWRWVTRKKQELRDMKDTI